MSSTIFSSSSTGTVADILSSSLDGLSSALLSEQSTRTSLANNALSTGISLLQDGKEEKAIEAFKTAAAYDPTSSDAYKYMGMAYAELGDMESAIEAYKKPVQLDPTDADARTDLANAYIDNGQYDEAKAQLEAEIKWNPRSSSAYYALGQLDLQMEEYDDAADAFKKVISLEPDQYNGYYGLGLAYNNQEKYAEAVDQLQKCISLKRDFAYAYCDLGYAYAGLGNTEKAEEQVDILYEMDTTESNSLAAELEISLYTPKITNIDSDSTLPVSFGANTQVYFLDPSLWTAGTSCTFSVVIQFNQAMDTSSVQNTLNWSISKAQGGTAGWYNNGLTVNASNEIAIPLIPTCVSYNASTCQATLYFTITQNSTGNGVTDPSHWVFKFTGNDISGNKIDSSGDEIDGAAGEAF
jgi:tetratricopeptide (TPR) repeat protein